MHKEQEKERKMHKEQEKQTLRFNNHCCWAVRDLLRAEYFKNRELAELYSDKGNKASAEYHAKRADQFMRARDTVGILVTCETIPAVNLPWGG